MALDQLFLEQFGGVDSNSLCYLLNNNIPRNNNVNIIDVEPDVMMMLAYLTYLKPEQMYLAY